MDMEFIDNAINKTVPLIKLAILPELVGRWFTKQKTTDDQTLSSLTKHRTAGATEKRVKSMVL